MMKIKETELTTARQVLDIIDQFIVENGTTVEGESRKLWDILCALRGPDCAPATPTGTKKCTTAVIRWHALPKAAPRMAIYWDTNPDPGGADLIRKELATKAIDVGTAGTDGLYHFYDHAQRAFHSLDLSWGYWNEEKTEREEE